MKTEGQRVDINCVRGRREERKKERKKEATLHHPYRYHGVPPIISALASANQLP